MSPREALNLKFYSKDLNKELTISHWFKELFLTLVRQKEQFSSHRPFGNSDWDCDVIACLIKNGLVEGKLDIQGDEYWIDECDWEQAYDWLNQLAYSFVMGGV